MKLFINSCAFTVQAEDHALAILRGNGESEEHDVIARLGDAFELWTFADEDTRARPVQWRLLLRGRKVRGERSDLPIPPIAELPEFAEDSGWVVERPEGVVVEGQAVRPHGPHYPPSVPNLPEFDRDAVRAAVDRYRHYLLDRLATSLRSYAQGGGTVIVEDDAGGGWSMRRAEP